MTVKYRRLLFIIIIFFSIVSPVFATEYSFEHAEKLTPLINWRTYGPEAFAAAEKESKPIFLLLTAPSWCYWCQVYESEDYLFNPDIVKKINDQFIPIYVNADDRQDLTRQYLEGGWPSTTILAPNHQRLFGWSGTRSIENMLTNLQAAVDYVANHGSTIQITYKYNKTDLVIPTDQDLSRIINNYQSYIFQSYDPAYGGFGTGQKFPQALTYDYALDMYDSTHDQQWLSIVQNSLQHEYTNVAEIETHYNLFDPIEGGFHRYGTTQSWSPPHYEKMLYDNAKLLRAYTHLLKIQPNDKITKEVVEKTNSFMTNSFIDEKNGGFYSNIDASPEERYYGLIHRPAKKPRVEKTKFTDWNSQAILSYLSLWQLTKDSAARTVAKQSLDFFAREMVTDQGAYHYQKPNLSKGVRGNLLDNSHLLLALVEGYTFLKNPIYLENAQKIADYSLVNLYDWNSGGFFERHSLDLGFYAPGEEILLTKPTEENGVMAYALIKLYKETNKLDYLDAAIKSIGLNKDQVGELDQGYYYAKAAQLIQRDKLLIAYRDKQDSVALLEQQHQSDFWLTKVLFHNIAPMTAAPQLSNQGVSEVQGPLLLLMLIALLAGLLSFLSPCTLPILPAYLGYTFSSSERSSKGMTVAFFLGLSLTFTLLGMSATFFGVFLKAHITLFSQVTGLSIIFFGIYSLTGRGLNILTIKKKSPFSYIGSFFFGTVFGISWTPCVGPVLLSILLLASTVRSVALGGLLLFTYSFGLAIPLLILSAYIDRIDKNGRFWSFIRGRQLQYTLGHKKVSIHTTTLITGILFIILGLLIFFGQLATLNQLIANTSFQKPIFSLENLLLNKLK